MLDADWLWFAEPGQLNLRERLQRMFQLRLATVKDRTADPPSIVLQKRRGTRSRNQPRSEALLGPQLWSPRRSRVRAHERPGQWPKNAPVIRK